MPTDPTSKILEEQTLTVKRGRLNGLGFEPAFNSYFDFYASSKYIDPPLLELEDIAFHLFLRKNLNDRNPRWKMPSIRQIRAKFRMGHNRFTAILNRLEQAHLLRKESGVGKGEYGRNTRNGYILSDPVQTLDEFLTLAREGVFGVLPRGEWLCVRNGHTNVFETDTSYVPETDTDQQTLTSKQTDEPFEDKLWQQVLSTLKNQTPAATFNSFVVDTKLLSIVDGVATVTTTRPFAIDWLRNRMKNNLQKTLNLELRLENSPQVTDLVIEVTTE
jgi:hypothetical protein